MLWELSVAEQRYRAVTAASQPQPRPEPDPLPAQDPPPVPADVAADGLPAVEVDREVPA